MVKGAGSGRCFNITENGTEMESCVVAEAQQEPPGWAEWVLGLPVGWVLVVGTLTGLVVVLMAALYVRREPEVIQDDVVRLQVTENVLTVVFSGVLAVIAVLVLNIPYLLGVVAAGIGGWLLAQLAMEQDWVRRKVTLDRETPPESG